MSSYIWYHLDARTIYLGGEINDRASADFFDAFVEMAHADNAAPIKLLMNSGGGNVYDALAICDIISQSNCPVVCHAFGRCFSSAVTILQACTTRILHPNTRLLLHEGSIENPSAHAPEAVADLQDSLATMNRCDEIIAQRSGNTLKEIRKLCRRVSYLSADESVKLNLADKIFSGI